MPDIDIRRFNDKDETYHAAAFDIIEKFEQNANRRILFLVSGGSSTQVTASIAKRLDINKTNSVTLALTDERWGEVGHRDSNWELLRGKGLDPTLFLSSTQILDEGTTIENAAHNYGTKLQSLIDQADYRICLIGVGADGALGGINPMSEQEFEKFLGADLAVGYQAQDYERITTTPRALLQLDEIIIYASGKEKEAAISSLSDDKKMHESPIHMLKKMQKVTIYFSPD